MLGFFPIFAQTATTLTSAVETTTTIPSAASTNTSTTTSTVTDAVESGLTKACGDTPGIACDWVYSITESETLAKGADWLSGAPFRILLILVGAWIAGMILRRAIQHFAARLVEDSAERERKGVRSRSLKRYRQIVSLQSKRTTARTRTIGSVLSSVSFATVWAVAGLMILGELNVNIGPLLAGAGVAGFAIGFGAQAIVKDFLSGVFMLVEDQFGVGDIIDAGFTTGTVEKVSLRTTTLRDITGTLWHIPNGEIHRVANKSQIWARALLDVEVSYDTDLRFAEGVVQRVADEMWADPEWGGDEIMEKPEVWGVQNLGADGIAIRLVVKTEPATQWSVERELRLRLKEAFDEAGLEIPFPQRTVWIRTEGNYPPSPKPDPSTITTTSPARYSKDFDNLLEDEEGDEGEEEDKETKRVKKVTEKRIENKDDGEDGD